MSDQAGDSGSEVTEARPTQRIGFVMSWENVRKVLLRIEEKAVASEQAAVRRAEQGDGGASLLRAEANAFVKGWSREDLPDAWWPIAMDIAREEDPEYGEWLRLKTRFGD